MAELLSKAQVSLPGEEVIVRAVQFFTTEKWRCRTQYARSATFEGRPPIPVGLIILTIIGFLFCIIPGVIMYILTVRKMISFQNIVVTVIPTEAGSEVSLTYPERVNRMVNAFVSSLPMEDRSREEWLQQIEEVRTETQSASERAIAALFLGILGVVGLGPAGIVALVLGSKELKAIDVGEAPVVGRQYAKAGLILGWISVGLLILFVLIILLSGLLGVVLD